MKKKSINELKSFEIKNQMIIEAGKVTVSWTDGTRCDLADDGEDFMCNVMDAGKVPATWQFKSKIESEIVSRNITSLRSSSF